MKQISPVRRPCLAALVFCLTWLTCLAPARAGDKQEAPKKVVTIEGITEYQLSNGLRFLLFPDPASSTVTVNLTVFVGSRHEGYGETGMAHLLEHMLFKGTPKHPDIDKVMQAHGAENNGTTWVDRTNYYETMPATKENLEFGIRLEADRLINSYVKREDLLKEMTVVRNEFERNENDPEIILNQRMMAVAYEWHNYGKSTMGNRTDIERVPIDRLQAFYRKHYQVDNVMLIVAGKFDEKLALDYITKYFGALKRPKRSLEKTYTEEPTQDGERVVILRRVGKVGVAGLIYHTPAGAHPDCAALDVLNAILVSAPSGRLYKALVETKKATRVTGDASGWHDPGVLELGARVADGSTPEEVRDIMIDLVENLGTTKITDEEVERAKRQLLAARERALTKSKRIAIELSEWAGAGDWRLLFIHRDRIAKVTPADVARVAAKYLKQSNRTVGLFLPTPATKLARAEIPPAPSIESLVKDYKGGKALASGEVFDPTPENIEKRVKRSKLSSGVKVALLPKKTRGEAVVAQLTLHFGNEKSLNGFTTTSKFLGPLMVRGTKKHTRQEIRDELDKLGAKLDAGSSTGELTFVVQAKRSTLPAVLSLLGEILREPTFPEKEFDILKRARKQAIEKGMTEPNVLAYYALQRHLNPYPKDNIRYVPTLEEGLARVQAVTREQVVKLYQDQLGGQAGELVVVGDFDAEATLKQVQPIFEGWKASVPYERITQEANTDVKGGRQQILTPDKENAVYMASHLLALTDAAPEYPALVLGNYVLGGSAKSRLWERLRQKEGLSYGVGSELSADAQDKYASFSIELICNPKNIDKADKAVAQELDMILKGGMKAEELAEAQKSYLQEQKVARSNDSTLASLLQEGLFLNRTFAYHAALEKKIADLTPEQVTGALRSHLLPDRLFIVRAGDFKKGGGKQK
jgi:zinc protease